MRAPIIFFRTREADGTTYDFVVETPKTVHHLCAYSTTPLDSKIVQTEKIRTEELFRDFLSDVHRTIAKGGGVLVLMSGQDCEILEKVVSVYPSADMQIEKIGVLKPGYPLHFESISKTNLSLPQGSQVIVPIDNEAQQRLLAFNEQLAGFPRDLESLVLYTLRRPSLDERLEKVEAKVLGRTATVQEEATIGRWRRRWVGLKSWTVRPVSRWPITATVIILLLACNTFLLYLLVAEKVNTPFLIIRKASPLLPLHPSPDPRGPQPKQPSLSLADVTQPLFSAIRDKKNTNQDLKNLLDNNFATYGEQLFNANVAYLFESTGNNRPFLLGLIKLEALRLNPQMANKEDFIRGQDNITDTKEVFRGLSPHILEQDIAARDLLAFLSCRLSPQMPFPGLPDTRKFHGTQELLFVQGKSCKEFISEKAVPGIKDLITFVKGG